MRGAPGNRRSYRDSFYFHGYDRLGSVTHASYRYLGAGRIVTEDYEDIDVKLDYSANNFDALDRFGRVVDQVWKDAANDEIDWYRYGYSPAGNRVWKENVAAGELTPPVHLDELYEYDAIDRLKSTERGNLVDGLDGKEIDGTPNFIQGWGLDGLGNWSEFDDDGDPQTRTINEANEIDNITGGWVAPEYDAAGNMIQVPRTDYPDEAYELTYDAWNRLVEVGEEGMGYIWIARYEYDGVNRRIVKDVFGEPSAITHAYYDDQWRCVQENRANPYTGEILLDPQCQYVWGARYIDAMVLRDRDTGWDGTLDERRYALGDASGTVVERFVYDPYGEATVLDADFSPDANGYSDCWWKYLYTSRELDYTSGLMYYRNRYYRTGLGMFVNRDPIGYEGSQWNLYRYVDCNPSNGVDSLGLDGAISIGIETTTCVSRTIPIFAAVSML